MRFFMMVLMCFPMTGFTKDKATTSVPVSTTTSSSSNPCQDPSLTQAIPRSPNDSSAPNLNANAGSARDQQVMSEVQRGNIPNFLRRLQPVTMANPNPHCAGGGPITLCVMPDYLSVGSDQDYLHMPLGRRQAMQLAGQTGFLLPTPAMVDAIYNQAQVTASPRTMPPDRSMTTTAVTRRHSTLIQEQIRSQEAYRPGVLVAGTKKDVVLTNRLSNASRIAIYGWHTNNNSVIQSLSTVHGHDYADYSQGVRFISQTAFVNGQEVSLRELLASTNCAEALNSQRSDGRGEPRTAPISTAILNQFPQSQNASSTDPGVIERSPHPRRNPQRHSASGGTN